MDRVHMLADEILSLEPYSVCQSDKDRIYSEVLARLGSFHRENCPEYSRIFRILGDAMPLPVSLFKEYFLKSIPDEDIFKVQTSSGTTGQQPSRIAISTEVAELQQRVLQKIVSDFIGSCRRPVLFIDTPSIIKKRELFSARSAAIMGFWMFSSKNCFALDDNMQLDFSRVDEFLQQNQGKPILIFGFTYMIWKYFCQVLKAEDRHYDLSQAFVIHGGGWKKLQAEAVSEMEFKETLQQVCGIKNVSNYYGMAEQTGTIYMECACGHLHVSSYSELNIRDRQTLSICGIGEEGIIQVISPFALSYPGHSILTEDLGVLLGVDDCPCGRRGKYFKITGRLAKAEVRGCSDVYER